MNTDIEKTKAIAFFDLDKTIISVYSEQYIASNLLRMKRISLWKYIRIIHIFICYELHLIKDYEELKSNITKLILAEKSVNDFEDIIDSIVKEHLVNFLYPEALDLINRYKKNGWFVYIVSSAYSEIVRGFKDILGIDGIYATNLSNDGTLYSGDISGIVYNGKNKTLPVIELCRKYDIDPEKCHAYGDHYSDRFMLESVGKAFTVNPDKKFADLACKRGWNILRWGKKK